MSHGVRSPALNRRLWLAGAGAVGLAVGWPALALGADPVASTRSGPVRGYSDGRIKIFKGVRYGASTESRRFLPPQAPEPWREVRDALDFGAQSPQIAGGDGGGLFRSWANRRPDSEDCLFLNVWTPGLRDGARRPVMVWFHGGGFVTGSGASHAYDGTRLAAKGDVVVVTVNHRLNAFGYTYLADASPALADSGNVGSLDMLLSLQWVRDNIAEFGGDPRRVLIFGESGGGAKVSTLMATPAAKGLFHRAVVQSGSSLKVREPAAAADDARKLMDALGLKPGQTAELQALPMARVLEGVAKSNAGFSPVVDGRSLPRHPFHPDAPAVSRDVPMLIGTTKDEMTLLAGARDPSLFDLTWEALPGRLAPVLQGMDPAAVVAALRKIYPQDKPSDIYFTASTEAGFRSRAVAQAERKTAQGGAPAYMYLLTWETPVMGGKWKSPHALEIGMVFDNVAKSESMSGVGPVQQRIADGMSDAWLRFAKSGDPGWPAYSPPRRATMVFDAQSQVVNAPREAERVMFSRLNT